MTAGRRSRQRPNRRQSRALPPRLEGLEARVVPVTFVVNTLADSGPGSLRDAVSLAEQSSGPDDITFSVTGTITLASALPSLSESLNLLGPGAGNLTVQWGAGFASGLFDIPS